MSLPENIFCILASAACSCLCWSVAGESTGAKMATNETVVIEKGEVWIPFDSCKDIEPGMPLIALINEGHLGGAWKTLRKEPFFVQYEVVTKEFPGK